MSKNNLFILLFLFLFPFTSLSQSLKINFEYYLFDFGIIKESDGKVVCNFNFKNETNFNIEIEEIQSGCGCIIPFVSNKIIQPGEKGSIKVEYDPEGRPGKFIKSIDLKISGNGIHQRVFLNIKGYVIEKNILPSYIELWEYGTLQIKPFYSEIISSSDFRFLNLPNLQNFINDITYEIDQNNFSTIKLELFMNEKTGSDELADAIFLPLKHFIITELIKRNYSINQIGFLEVPFVEKKDKLENALALLKISSLSFNNNEVNESGYIINESKAYENYLNKISQRKQSDSTQIKHLTQKIYTLKPSNGKVNTKDQKYDQYIQSVTREVLMKGIAYIQFSYSYAAANENIEVESKKIDKHILSVQNQIKKDLKKQGITGTKINFYPTTLYIYPENSENELKIIQLSSEQIIQNSIDNNSILNIIDTNYKAKSYLSSQSRIQDLPTYFQFFEKGKIQSDTSKREFIIWMKMITEILSQQKNVSFIIEASESKYGNGNHLQFALQRMMWMKNYLTDYFSRLNITLPLKSTFHSIKGIKYDFREFGITFQEKHQYIKIIPFYDSVISKTEELFPYQVNFKYNIFDFPSNSDLFQLFINRIDNEIRKIGYIKIILESSSSRVPVENYANNEMISYKRMENLKAILIQELKTRGTDPRRIIFTEERAIVGGPLFLKGDSKNAVQFQPYQYVKIIPEKIFD